MLRTVAGWITPPRKRTNAPEGMTSVRSDRELGLIAWAMKHTKRCLDKGVMQLDLSTDAGVQSFVDTVGLDVDRMTRLGERARSVGCAKSYAYTLFAMTEDHTAWILADMTADWQMLDGTMCIDVADEDSRYLRAPQLGVNTCALDSALVLANFMQVGRIQADAIELSRLYALQLPAFTLRYLISRPIGSLSQRQWNEVRDSMLQVIHEYDSSRYSLTAYKPFNTLLQDLFTDLPQVSWYEVRGVSCCADKIETIRSSEPRYRNSIYINFDQRDLSYPNPDSIVRARGTKSLNDALTLYLNDQRPAAPDEGCGKTECRTKTMCLRHVVLGRLPPRLVVCLLSRVGSIWAARLGLFEDATILYRSLRGKVAVVYTVVGAVFLLRGNHFTCRWRHTDGRISSVDSGVIREVGDWWQNYEQDGTTDDYPIVDTLILQRKTI